MNEDKGTRQIKKLDSVNIIQISAGYASIYGLGSDMKIYTWNKGSVDYRSPGFGNCWIYYEQRV